MERETSKYLEMRKISWAISWAIWTVVLASPETEWHDKKKESQLRRPGNVPACSLATWERIRQGLLVSEGM